MRASLTQINQYMFFKASLITAQGHGQNSSIPSQKRLKLARLYAVFLLCVKKSNVSACFSSKKQAKLSDSI